MTAVSSVTTDPTLFSEEMDLEKDAPPPTTAPPSADSDLAYPSTFKQYTILLTLNLAMLVSVVGSSALFVVVSQASSDLGLVSGDASWLLTAYVITFASFQLSMGRLADLTSAGWTFTTGIGFVAIFTLILSFMTNGIVFIILRALQGIASSATIPSSYNLAVRTFPAGKARNRALAVLGLVGSVSFSVGVIIGGLFESVSWRWLFRLLSIISFLAFFLALLIVPKQRIHKTISLRTILIRLDPVGLLLSVGAVILFVLALTSGPKYGWADPRFSAGLPVSAVMFASFFVWEAKGRSEEQAMLPAVIWKTPTVKPLVFLNLAPFMFWSTTSYGFPTFWQDARGISSITTALRLLPVGLAAFSASILIQLWPQILSARRWPVFTALPTVALMLILYVFSEGGGDSTLYWKFLVPAFAVGSGLCQFVFLSNNVFVITSVEPARAGVAGALMSVVMQLGNALGLALQTACLGQGQGQGRGEEPSP